MNFVQKIRGNAQKRKPSTDPQNETRQIQTVAETTASYSDEPIEASSYTTYVQDFLLSSSDTSTLSSNDLVS